MPLASSALAASSAAPANAVASASSAVDGVQVVQLVVEGLALLDADATAVRLHRGTALGDYPPVAVVVEELRRLAGG